MFMGALWLLALGKHSGALETVWGEELINTLTTGYKPGLFVASLLLTRIVQPTKANGRSQLWCYRDKGNAPLVRIPIARALFK